MLGLNQDRGQTITSRWGSGWGDYGNSQVKTIRETKLWGKGNVVVGFSTDYHRNQRVEIDAHFGPIGTGWTYAELTARGGTYDDLETDFTDYITLAAGEPLLTAADDAMVRYATRGVLFSTQFSNSPASPAWNVHRVAKHLREVREPSMAA